MQAFCALIITNTITSFQTQRREKKRSKKERGWEVEEREIRKKNHNWMVI
jgi:hypothetical protein